MRRLPTLLAISLTFTACSGPESSLPPGYRSVVVPEGRLGSPEARSRGRELFKENCTLCHGPRGDGHGLRSSGLAKRPTDFTKPVWRQGVTPRRVYFAIREGLHGTPMPSWKWLGEDAAWDLVAYVLSLDRPEPVEGDASGPPVSRPSSTARSAP